MGTTTWSLTDGAAELDCVNVTLKASQKITCQTPTLEVPNGDIIAGGVSLTQHVHKDVRAGNDFSGPPVGWSPATGGGGSPPEPSASQAAYENGGTRAKYGQTPVWLGETGAGKIWSTQYPADTARISEDTYYDRFRIAQDRQIGGEPKRVFSQYDRDADTFSEATIQPWNEADFYYGAVPHGMLATDVEAEAYKVYTAEDGAKLVLYSPVEVEIKLRPPWYDAYVAGKETFMVLYKITDEEFEQWKNPPPEGP